MFNMTQLLDFSTAKKYPKNTVIIHEGEQTPYCMYIVLSGSVRVVKHLDKFDQVVLAVLKPGDFFGEMSLFLQRPRTASVIAAEEAAVLEINESNVYEVFEKSPQVLYNILKTQCARIDDLNDRVRTLPKREHH